MKTITKVCRPPTSGPIHLPKRIQNSPNTIPFSKSFFLYFLLYLHYWANFSISFQSKINYQITESFYFDIRKCSTLCSIHKITMYWLDKFTEHFLRKKMCTTGYTFCYPLDKRNNVIKQITSSFWIKYLHVYLLEFELPQHNTTHTRAVTEKLLIKMAAS